MPSVPIHPSQSSSQQCPSPLPPLLQTPAGLALIEIQGSLNLPEPETENDPVRQQIGRLEFPLLHHEQINGQDEGPWMKKVYLYVGERQRLAGEIKKLDKPIGILSKRHEKEAGGEVEGEALEILDIVRWKIYFGTRPEFV